MMASLNKIILIGRLGRDPEITYMPSGDAICKFSIATSESWKDKSGQKQEKTEWHNIVIYRKLAEIAGEYLKKGGEVYLEGKKETQEWEKDGVKRQSVNIVCHEMKMLGGKPDLSCQSNQSKAEYKPSTSSENTADDDFDSIPF